MKVHDRNALTIDVIDGVRTEDRNPRRTVTLNREDVPELPEMMEWRGQPFFPDKVTILYFGSRDTEEGELEFYQAEISGPIVRKNGKPGVAKQNSTHFARPEGLSQKRLDHIGDYLVPAYLLPHLDRLDPIHGDIKFAAE